MKTGLKDKNNTEILIGQKVKFKYYNHWHEVKVQKWEKGIYPFIPDISEKVGFYIEPNECEVIEPTPKI